ncbi:MAG: hypothetical protein KJ709_02390 [Nanoarchaeota archaeon]|nr:hypothetical protein [Nanoarchaeota archaeon]
MPMHRFFDPMMFVPEVTYTLIVVVLCLIIYLKTREIYDLTKHRGIYYFRNTFLFFGLAYVFRFFFYLFHLTQMALQLDIPRRVIGPASLVLTGYLSTMAILYLVYSSLWKRLGDKKFLILSNLAAAIISVIALMTKSPYIITIAQAVLLAAALITGYFLYKKSKKFYELLVLYLLLSIFWITSLLNLGQRVFMPFELRLGMQLISIVVFIIIYLKVAKWAK